MAAAEGAVIACHTTDEFNAQMAKAKESSKLVIIDFMTPCCGGCIAIAPVFAKCAKKYPAAVFLKVDCHELEEVARKYDIHAYPSFVFIRNGETLESYTSSNPDKLENTIKKYY